MKIWIILAISVIVLIAGIVLFVQLNKGVESVVTTSSILSEEAKKTPNEQIEESETYNINIKNFAFSKKELRIKKGDTVIWTNLDYIWHTVTSNDGEELNSELLSKNEKYIHKFTKSGIFEYYCKPHTNMKGQIIVE